MVWPSSLRPAELKGALQTAVGLAQVSAIGACGQADVATAAAVVVIGVVCR